MNYLKLLLAGLILLAIGGGLGYHYAPEKVKEVEKIVEKEKIVKEEYKKKTKKYDKDGKLIEESEESGNKESKTNEQKKEKEIEKIKDKKMYAVKGGAVINPRDLSGKVIPRVGVEMRLPLFNSWVGAEADINVDRPLIGGYLRLEF